ncbi:DUF1611 domain-containing protein [Botrimarina sp.]|uniref:DUF1611 domain-containing protein n=1 Tax=Botrimarina sp. TaxID=2795802 RepID=UPI0032EAF35F
MSNQPRRIVLLTDGKGDPISAKTAVNVLRYRGEQAVAVLDRQNAGKTAEEVLGVGGQTPIVASLAEAPDANTLMVGVAPAGGKVPPEWMPTFKEAIDRGMDLVSGLHDFLGEVPELRDAAAEKGVSIWDVRKNRERDVATGEPFREGCLRLLTIGNDCSVGKMLAALEVANDLKARGENAKFLATGQTGIMIEGDGIPIDCVVADFINGAAEKLVRQNEQHDIVVVEGQATIAHPRYSSVSLGLLHGCRPQGMILVYEAGRPHMNGLPHAPLRPLKEIVEAYESAAALLQCSKVIAVAINSRRLSPREACDEAARVSDELGLPAVDPIRDGPGVLSDAVLALRDELFAPSAG